MCRDKPHICIRTPYISTPSFQLITKSELLQIFAFVIDCGTWFWSTVCYYLKLCNHEITKYISLTSFPSHYNTSLLVKVYKIWLMANHCAVCGWKNRGGRETSSRRSFLVFHSVPKDRVAWNKIINRVDHDVRRLKTYRVCSDLMNYPSTLPFDVLC